MTSTRPPPPPSPRRPPPSPARRSCTSCSPRLTDRCAPPVAEGWAVYIWTLILTPSPPHPQPPTPNPHPPTPTPPPPKVRIYRDFDLLWAAALPSPAAALRVASFGGQPGLICSMDLAGQIAISYLGTQPPSTQVATEVKELNYEAMDEEHRRLLQIIRDSSSDDKVEPKEKIALRAQVPTPEKAKGDDGGAVSSVTVRIFVSYSGDAPPAPQRPSAGRIPQPRSPPPRRAPRRAPRAGCGGAAPSTPQPRG